MPMLCPRVKEAHEPPGLVVDRTDIAPFPYVAAKASIREVIGIRRAAMFAANDVVYLMW